MAPLQSEAGCKRAHLLLAHLDLHWQAANEEDLCIVANALLRSEIATQRVASVGSPRDSTLVAAFKTGA